jgi:hypothetical protein
VALNAADMPAALEVPTAGAREVEWVVPLKPQRPFPLRGGRLQPGAMPPTSGRVPRRE